MNISWQKAGIITGVLILALPMASWAMSVSYLGFHQIIAMQQSAPVVD